jgi:uncharacterized Ntn-hydrolase superfamily protein
MTFSIIARCPKTRRLGLGITTFSIAAGGRCEGIRHGVGICKTQAYINRGNDLLALQMLEQGLSPAAVMKSLEANDPDHEFRQIAIVDREGNACAHTGPGPRPWAGHHVGDGFVAFGNVLAGPQVIDGIVKGFLANPDDELEFRLLAALEGGRDAGGQVGNDGHLPERSAAIYVVSEPDHPDIDARVDLHPEAVSELRRVLEEFKLYEVFYRERGHRPDLAMSQDQFVATLAKRL